jgi:glycosyltransferase involved in cell wall biosynthesis
MRSNYSLVFVIGGLSRGGIESHLVDVVTDLVKRSVDVSVIVLFDRGPLLELLIDTGVQVVYPNKPISGSIHFRQLLSLDYVAHFFRCWKLLRRPGTIVHAFMPTNLIAGWALSKVANVETVIASRVSRNFYKADRPLIHRCERFINRRIYAVFGNSRKVVNDLAQEGVPDSKIRLIYTGIDKEIFGQRSKSEMRSMLGIERDQLVLCKVANLIPYKGHHDLLKALCTIKDELPKDWLLLLVGRDDGIGTALRDLSEQLGIEKNILFMGSRDDVNSILCAGDIGILTSHTEGFATAILEYMATGIPVIATDVGGNQEALGDAAGVIVKVHDIQDIGRQIACLAQNEQLRISMGKAGLDRISKKFSVKATVDQYIETYEMSASTTSTDIPGNLMA